MRMVSGFTMSTKHPSQLDPGTSLELEVSRASSSKPWVCSFSGTCGCLTSFLIFRNTRSCSWRPLGARGWPVGQAVG